MRLRKIPRALGYLEANKNVVITDFANQKLSDYFKNDKPIHLEIGCGKGKFIIEMAKHYPQINFIALEKYDSVLLRAVERYNALEDRPTNLVFVLGDILDFIPHLTKHSIAEIYLNFSDPWPKNRQAKRRLTYINFLKQYQEILIPGGYIVQKTDNHDLFMYSLEQYDLADFDVIDVSYDLHKTDKFNITTEFEDKWSPLGPIYYDKVRV